MKKVAERTFFGIDELRVDICIYEPELNDNMWKCHYDIVCINMDLCKKSYGGGADSMQAILMAISKIKIYLEGSKKFSDKELCWIDEGNLDLQIWMPAEH